MSDKIILMVSDESEAKHREITALDDAHNRDVYPMPRKDPELWDRPPAQRKRESGQALAEYSLVLALIAVACILALTALGLAVAGELDGITAALP